MEAYYWDSYFACAGLLADGDSDLLKLLEGMVENFRELIDGKNGLGYIPNGDPASYLGRSQAPFFSLMIGLLEKATGKINSSYFNALEKEYRFWMNYEVRDRAGRWCWTRSLF